MDSSPIHDPGPGGSDILATPQKTRHDGEMPESLRPGADMESGGNKQLSNAGKERSGSASMHRVVCSTKDDREYSLHDEDGKAFTRYSLFPNFIVCIFPQVFGLPLIFFIICFVLFS